MVEEIAKSPFPPFCRSRKGLPLRAGGPIPNRTLHEQKMGRLHVTFAERIYHYSNCGLILDRDLQAAITILRVRLPSVALA